MSISPPFLRDYIGTDTIPHFIKKIHELQEKIMVELKEVEPMVMTAQDELNHASATECCLCKKPLDDDTVREHCHLTGKYRGAAHSQCNLKEGNKRTRRYKIPVFFHNLKGYDSHMIVSEVGKYVKNLQAIPQNYEKMISFSYGHLRYLDSLAFLSSSLDKLVENLYEEARTTEEGQTFTKNDFKKEYENDDWKQKWKAIEHTAVGRGKHKFVHSKRHCQSACGEPKPEHLDLMLKKGVYPYDYMNSWEKMDETELPPKDSFFSRGMTSSSV